MLMNKILKFSVKIALLAFGVMSLLSALAVFFLGFFPAAVIFLAIGIVCTFIGWAYGKSGSRILSIINGDIRDLQEKQREKEEREKESKRTEEERSKEKV